MFRRALLVVPLVLVGGCGTLVNQSEPGTTLNAYGTVTPYRPYGGVRHTAMAMTQPGMPDPFTALGMAAKHMVHPPDRQFIPVWPIDLFVAFQWLDLPVSAAADTILLPWDVVRTLQGRGEPPPGGWPRLRRSPNPELPAEPSDRPPTQSTFSTDIEATLHPAVPCG
jgi:uncharacterized protein YceK